MYSKEEIDTLNERFAAASPQEVLRSFMTQFGDRLALSSSLSIEDQTLTDMMVQIDANVRIFTLDTGRLFPETYNLIDDTNHHYNIHLEVYSPQAEPLQDFVREHGINPFYDSIELRHACCQVRKLEPLKRAFRGLEAWVCGLRHGQSVTRGAMRLVEWDEVHGMLKINPLINWDEAQVWAYIKEHRVPYNELHDKGYTSIGCEPCTRAVRHIDDIRAGRWWWENPDHRECGLHRR
ncbi:MAG: phosphoadenylyl-sulfate reductase [Bacteroidales bacterium]|nr:phosphoadenylyl-sulfate reductase [Bacteroidales bacterium]